MGRQGRSQRFLDHWDRRELALSDGGLLRWTLIDNPARAPHAECFELTATDGATRLRHPAEALVLLEEHDHPDAAHVPTVSFVGAPFAH